MADEKVQEEEVLTPEAEQPEETPEVEPSQEEPQEPENQEEETLPVEEAPEDPIEEKPSRRESLRIQQILDKAKRGDFTNPKPTGGIDYNTALNADPEVLAQLEQDRRTVSDQAFNQGIRQAEVIGWKTMLSLQSPTVEKEYKFLDKNDAENFNPAAANAMNTKYLKFVGYDRGDTSKGIPESVQDPSVSYLDFVAAEMEFANEIASQKVANTTRNIAKQAATTALRPDGSQTKSLNLNKAPGEMSDEELDAVLATLPKSAR